MINNEILESLKNLTVAEFIAILTDKSISTKSNKRVLTTEELLKEYPMFSRYTLNKAIKEQNLPFYREGHRMFFEKDLVDEWINNRTTTYKIKTKNRYRI